MTVDDKLVGFDFREEYSLNQNQRATNAAWEGLISADLWQAQY